MANRRELQILGIPRSWLNIPLGVPQLDATGKILSSQLPAIAITQVFVVASEAAMLALVAEIGDVAKRTDLQPNQSFMLSAAPPSVLANWIKISDIAIDFTTLLDTPNNYTGATNKWVKVNGTADGLEFLTHDKALHDALGIDAAQVDGKEANDFLWRDGTLAMLGDLDLGAFEIKLDNDKAIYLDTANSKTLKWNSASGRFEFNNDVWATVLHAFDGPELISGAARMLGYPLFFNTANTKTLKWSGVATRFEFNDDVYMAGDIILTGLLDGVDLAALKTAYDAHDHSAGDPTQVDYPDLLSIPSSFTPSIHGSSTHQNGQTDEFSVAGLSGLLADAQTPLAHALDPASGPHTGTLPEASVVFNITTGHDHDGANSKKVDYPDLLNIPSSFTPSAHKDSHKSGGGDAFLSTDLLEAVVKRIRTTTGPTDLLVGAVADGEYLKRSGAAIIGGTPAGDGQKAMEVILNGNTNPFKNTAVETYQVMGTFIFPGTTKMGTPSKIKAIAWKNATATTFEVKIYDYTNSQTIAELTGATDLTKAIKDLGTLSNLPAAEAQWEIQIRAVGGTGGRFAYISSVVIEW